MSVQLGNHHPAPAADAPSLSDRVRSLRLQTGGAAVRPRSSWLPWGLTIIALIMAGAFGARAYLIAPSDVAGKADQGSDGSERKATVYSPGNAAAAPGEVVLDGNGYVIAEHQIQLSPQVGGEIIKLDANFKEGAIYKKGDFLAQVDPEIYEAQMKSADAALHVARVNLQQVESGSALQDIATAKAQLKNLSARLELTEIDERNKRRAGTATPRDDMEKATVQLVVDRAALDAQRETVNKLETSLLEQRLVNKAQVQKAEADLAQAKKQLKNCTIVAPTTGMILTKKAEQGGYVNPLAYSGVAGYLCEMADLTKLEVELDIQERDIGQLRFDPSNPQRCRIMPEAGKRDEQFLKIHPQGYTGYISRRMPMANRSKGAITVRVKIEIPEEEEGGKYLLPDMNALVWFLK